MLSIIMGYDNTLGYYLSLMRFFTFLPYFVLGITIRKFFKGTIMIENKRYKRLMIFILTCVIFVFSYYLIRNADITRQILYGSYTYSDLNYSPIIKIFLLCFGLIWTVYLLLIVSDKKIPFITSLGQHTFAVFLLHGFIVKLCKKYAIFHYTEEKNFLLTLILTALIVVTFGNRFVAEGFEILFTGKWLDKVWCRINNIK